MTKREAGNFASLAVSGYPLKNPAPLQKAKELGSVTSHRTDAPWQQ